MHWKLVGRRFYIYVMIYSMTKRFYYSFSTDGVSVSVNCKVPERPEREENRLPTPEEIEGKLVLGVDPGRIDLYTCTNGLSTENGGKKSFVSSVSNRTYYSIARLMLTSSFLKTFFFIYNNHASTSHCRWRGSVTIHGLNLLFGTNQPSILFLQSLQCQRVEFNQ